MERTKLMHNLNDTAKRQLRILQVSSADIAGGAETSARNLHREFQRLGHDSRLMVGTKRSDEEKVIELPNDSSRNALVKILSSVLETYDSQNFRLPGIGRVLRILREISEPGRWVARRLGVEDYAYPGTRRLLRLFGSLPDIIHCHNLHSGYFDLRELLVLSFVAPVILNLRDAWLLTGHCALPLKCERWRIGCGKCPDLTIFPSVKRDATRFNWKRKQRILRKRSFYVATASQWLMEMVLASPLREAIATYKVIPNGVDTSVFFPSSREEARVALGIAPRSFILMFSATALKDNVWKDLKTMKTVLRIIGAESKIKNVKLLAVGDSGDPLHFGHAQLRYVPYQSDPAVMACYYRAADLYLHAAKVETFGNTLIEARACGTPVVATAVGGIPEHTKGLKIDGCNLDSGLHGRETATGVLVDSGDAEGMARVTIALLQDVSLRQSLSRNAAVDAKTNYSLRLQAERFVTWYWEIIRLWRGKNQM
jgi:glycosyltransferase involved in cell wall biosynthesis